MVFDSIILTQPSVDFAFFAANPRDDLCGLPLVFCAGVADVVPTQTESWEVPEFDAVGLTATVGAGHTVSRCSLATNSLISLKRYYCRRSDKPIGVMAGRRLYLAPHRLSAFGSPGGENNR